AFLQLALWHSFLPIRNSRRQPVPSCRWQHFWSEAFLQNEKRNLQRNHCAWNAPHAVLIKDGVMRFSVPLLLALSLIPSTGLTDDAGVLNVILENDAFANTDHHYTSGIMFSYAGGRNASSPKLQQLLRQFPGISEKDAIYTGFHIGQQIFTPENIHSEDLLVNQRPYAGYLFAGFSLLAAEEYETDSWKLSIGRVGPSARAEEFQTSIHSRLGVNVAQGWEHQLADETILQFDYHKTWREVLRLADEGLAADFMPFAGIALGNAAVHADAGFSLRIGRNLGSDLGPPRMHPSLPNSSIFNASGGWYFFVGVGG